VAERAHVLQDCAGLRERVASLETQLHPLLALSTQLSALSTHVSELKAELASFKGRVIGGVAALTFVAPLIASAVTALFVRFMKLG
jgi:hypothetical protein